jgi:hypothetical protein
MLQPDLPPEPIYQPKAPLEISQLQPLLLSQRNLQAEPHFVDNVDPKMKLKMERNQPFVETVEPNWNTKLLNK